MESYLPYDQVLIELRMQEVSKRKYEEIADKLIDLITSRGAKATSAQNRVSKLMNGHVKLDLFEANVICECLAIRLADLLNPAFSLRDAESCLIEEEEAQIAASYGLNKHAA